MRIIVIGSKGFIGSHAVAFFKSQPYSEVFECDVVSDYATENYFLIDATNSNYVEIFRNHTFDFCINCSGAASVPDSLVNPLRDFTLNTYNVVKLLDAIRIHQPACKLVNLSSAAVYGNPEFVPVREDLALRPISPYGTHKMQAELACQMYYDFYGISTCSLRIFSAYGNGLKKQLFWDLFQKAKKGPGFEVYGTGTETRDFIHVDDVVRAISYCLQYAPFKGEAINIANGVEITIAEAVNTFLSFFPETKKAHFNKMAKKGDPLNWRADISRLRGMGYSPTVTIKQGLEKYFQWISQI